VQERAHMAGERRFCRPAVSHRAKISPWMI
jgi:hypothetical protein